jgi:hypothetical protein
VLSEHHYNLVVIVVHLFVIVGLNLVVYWLHVYWYINNVLCRWMTTWWILPKKRQQGLLLLAELSQYVIRQLGYQYTDRYLHKEEYRKTQETELQWVIRCMSRSRHLYKMFRMSLDIFMALYDLLISNYVVTSTSNVLLMESFVMFLWIVGGPRSFSQAEDRFTLSLWTIRNKFHEVSNCLRKLAKDNIKPRDPNFSIEHEKVKEDRFWPYSKARLELLMVHMFR